MELPSPAEACAGFATRLTRRLTSRRPKERMHRELVPAVQIVAVDRAANVRFSP